ncbi:glycosyltransferase [Phaeovulum vinaykumarii]|uniref:Glycosyl transferases group 1 n=1 Tax=Phaeovulum vinaykumarii TaxID=407234 RepID=A0A1N7N260_9RHOB|nr:glycosyltransferase [Phaeovulum vinaykumarii]SIS92466.1 Glycosyl transferases group 1 [Phaeovulum vinaykumarii]SOC18622.1 glycosyl transferase family 1 [Phaeovulum vinaykumarii]
MNNAAHTSMSSNETSQPRVINVLWSSRAFGGAEVYVETMRTIWGTETCALQSLSAKERLKLAADIAFGSNIYIFHDLRAAFFGFLRPTRRNITVIHAPGKWLKLTQTITFLHAFLQKRVVMVADDIYPDPPTDHVVVLENFSTAGIEAHDASADAIYFGRMAHTKNVLDLAQFWHDHMKTGTLHMLGDGALLAELRAKYEHEGSNIRFHGAVAHDRITEIASECRFYTSFSGLEGLSLSLIEAMDGGLIPLVTDLPSQQFVKQIPGIPLVTVKGDYTRLAAEIEVINTLPPEDRAALRDTVRTTVRDRFRDRWMGFWDQTIREARKG